MREEVTRVGETEKGFVGEEKLDTRVMTRNSSEKRVRMKEQTTKSSYTYAHTHTHSWASPENMEKFIVTELKLR